MTRRAIPGFQPIEKLSDPELAATAVAGEGKGGAVSFAKGSARVELEADGEAIVLRDSARARANDGGKLAQVGSGLIDSTAKPPRKRLRPSPDRKSRGGSNTEGGGRWAASAGS